MIFGVESVLLLLLLLLLLLFLTVLGDNQARVARRRYARPVLTDRECSLLASPPPPPRSP